MKNLYIFFALFIFAPLFSSAQANFKSGYMITLQGDTISGFINYKDWNVNPKEIAFKKDSIGGESQLYTTADLSAFAINGYEYYKRYAGKISWDRVENTTMLSVKMDTDTRYGVFFFRVISTGKNVTLYKYTDRLKERFFIAENGRQPVELAYHMFLLLTGETKRLITDYGYKDQLQKLAAIYQPQNAVLAKKIKNVSYTNDLKKIVRQLNGLANK
jgi:hypothetical protein